MSHCQCQHPRDIPLFQLVSLMELLQFNASEFCRISGILAQTLTYIRCGKQTFNSDHWSLIYGSLGSLQRECEALDLRSSLAHIKRLRELVVDRDLDIDAQLWERFCTEIQTRIVDDLAQRWFLHIPPSSVDLYRQSTPPFGAEVEKTFPQMSEDISEAAKCLALQRSTAVVFHLMRVMELGVQSFGTKLGIALAHEKNWQNILDEVNKNVKGRDHKLAETKAYAEAASHLYNVKVAWRNEVMHPKQTYTDEEATAIFGNVRTFVGDLARLI